MASDLIVKYFEVEPDDFIVGKIDNKFKTLY